MQKPNNVFRRETLVLMLRAAIANGELRFARQAALAWLAAYPGDLEVMLLQAQTVLKEGRPAPAMPALEMLARKDPFSIEVYQTLAGVYRKSDPARFNLACSNTYVLSGVQPPDCQLLEWAKPLRTAYLAYLDMQFVAVEENIQEAMQSDASMLLTSVLHLLLQREKGEAMATFHLASIYQERWPDCLPINLVLAEMHLELGNEPEAVRLLHLGVANDSTGKVARWLWGESHPYRGLWPDEMVFVLEQPIPAGVAASLGWNQLAPGEISQTEGDLALHPEAEPEPKPESDEESLIDAILAKALARNLAQEQAESRADPAEEPAVALDQPVRMDHPVGQDELRQGRTSTQSESNDAKPVKESTGKPRKGSRRRKLGQAISEDTLKKVQHEFEVLAKKLNQPALGRADGRYPVYLVLSSREGLMEKYGPQTTGIIENELRRLAALVSKRAGWGARVYFPDDTYYTEPFGLTPVDPRDPWKVKHALKDLDAALAKKGEMIGALLIVGDDRVVPFHRLPNPTEDADGEIPSDSPYATLGANYFIPEWPVGRLPGEAGPDAGLLLEQLRQVQRYHDKRAKGQLSVGVDWLFWLRSLLKRLAPDRSLPNFALTAAVWRRSSLAVFRPIGPPHTVMASPPTNSGAYNPERIISSGLSYYNLHGLEDSPAWYGQRDPYDPDDETDYPVALTPQDLKRNGHSPRFVFSEACYGGHIHGKTESTSLALKFLSLGTLGVVASTCISYGSVSMPLIAADLLGFLFWQHMKQGSSAGHALQQAKIDLVREMDARQGYLDGEDQKTLISFVLYGDPLATYEGFRVRMKTVFRVPEQNGVKAVSDHVEEGDEQPSIPPAVMKQVKQIVTQYLPGAEMGEVHFCRLPLNGALKAADGSNGSHSRRKNGSGHAERLVVTASKQVVEAQHVHRQYIRFTLDERGKTLKLSVSR